MEREPDHSGDSEQSEQLPEDAPPEVAEDDKKAGDDGEEKDSAGVPDDPGQATGHPDNAG